MKFRALLMPGMLAFGGSALAEGNRSAGYYSVGGQGTQGCTPIPNYTAGHQQPPPPPQPTGYSGEDLVAITPSSADACWILSGRQRVDALPCADWSKQFAGCK